MEKKSRSAVTHCPPPPASSNVAKLSTSANPNCISVEGSKTIKRDFQSNYRGYRGRAPREAPNDVSRRGCAVEDQEYAGQELLADWHSQPSDEVKINENVKDKRFSKRGGDASHLLNFTFEPRGRERPVSGQSHRRNWSRSYPRLSKEQFLQANCQFVVNSAFADWLEYVADADKLVNWEAIEQVRLFDPQVARCPICLDTPCAAKITKCAHIYCWPCLLHYISLSDKPWARCPICHDPVEAKDLKSVLTIASPQFKVGDEITMRLMRRERGSQYVRPKETWTPDGGLRMSSLSDDSSDVRHSKLLMASEDSIELLVAQERRELNRLLSAQDTESLEASFVKAALTSLEERGAELRCRKSTKDSLTNDMVSKSAEHRTNPAIPVAECEDGGYRGGTLSSAVAPVVKYADAFDQTIADCVASSPAGVELCVGRSRSSLSTSSSSCGDSEVSADLHTVQVVEELALPPTGTQPGRAQAGGKPGEVYYFYQAADGQHVYLHSLNTRMFAAQYGSLECAPPTITATIVESEATTMTAELRKRLRYLSHLPLYCQFSVVELALRPPLVGSTTISHFFEEVEARRKVRNRRQRAEKVQQRKALAEERRAMGKYPDMKLPLSSNQHFPETLPAPGLSNTEPEVLSSQPLGDAVGAVPVQCSFAQVMKSGPAVESWPRVHSSPTAGKAASPKTSALAGDEEESFNAPSYKESFGAAIGALFDHLSVISPDQPAPKKNKKKAKQKLLFSTSAQRANP